MLLLLTCGILFIRLMIPAEFSITKSVYLSGIYASACGVLRKNIWMNLSLVEVLFILDVVVILFITGFKIYQYERFCMLIHKQGTLINSLTVTSFLKRKITIPVIKLSVIREPFIFGAFKPKIVVPEQCSYNYKYMIEHELQHYRNHDLLYKMFFDIVSTIYWWNPFIYILKKYVGNLFELYNDFSITMKSSEQEKIEYTETLLHTARKKKEKYSYMGLGISSNESFLKTRVHSIFNKEKIKFSPLIVITCGIIFLSFFLVIEPSRTQGLSEKQFLLEDNPYLVERKDSHGYTYDVYVGETFMGNIKEIPKDFANLEIIKEK